MPEEKSGGADAVLSDIGSFFADIFSSVFPSRESNHETWFHDFLYKQIGEWGISRALFMWLIFAGLYIILGKEIPDVGLFTYTWLLGTASIWLPVVLYIAAWRVWIWYIQALYISGRDGILLEIKMPREIFKSPRAMETALTNFWISSGEVTYIHRAWRGQVRPWFTMEIASFAGDIHFYMWTWRSYKNVVEMALYGQYPTVEIREVEDYAAKFQFDPKKHMCFSTDYALAPQSDAYPLKTYVDYELDKDPKEEFKVDPLAQVLEFMGSIKPHEQVWVQIVFQQCGRSTILTESNDQNDWRDRIKEAVAKIRKESSITPGMENAPEDAERKYGFPRPTWAQTEQLRSIERNAMKLPFDVVARGFYIADTTKGSFSSSTYGSTRWLWRAFANPGYLNQLRPRFKSNGFDYPWQDIGQLRWDNVTRRHIDAIRRRSAFHSPWKGPEYVMTPEVMASIWHPPSSTVASPGISRIPAVKAEPPPNLPK